jgi:hypothetical protein
MRCGSWTPDVRSRASRECLEALIDWAAVESIPQEVNRSLLTPLNGVATVAVLKCRELLRTVGPKEHGLEGHVGESAQPDAMKRLDPRPVNRDVKTISAGPVTIQ